VRRIGEVRALGVGRSRRPACRDGAVNARHESEPGEAISTVEKGCSPPALWR
jgi:hypothetical protein